MDSWLKQSHFPLLTVSLLADNRIRLQQQAFLLEPSLATTATTSTTVATALWIVPLRVVCVTNGVRRTTAAVMRTRELEIQLPADVSELHVTHCLSLSMISAVSLICTSLAARVAATSATVVTHQRAPLQRKTKHLLIECTAAVHSYDNSALELPLVVNEAHAGFFVTHYADERSWQAAFRAAVSSSSDSSCSDGATEVEAVGLVQDLILLLHQAILRCNDEQQLQQPTAQHDSLTAAALHARLLSIEAALRRSTSGRQQAAWFAAAQFLWDIKLAVCRALLQQARARSAGDTDAVALLPLALPLAVPPKAVTASVAAAVAAVDTAAAVETAAVATEEADSVTAALTAAESVAAEVRHQLQLHEQQLAAGWELAEERLHSSRFAALLQHISSNTLRLVNIAAAAAAAVCCNWCCPAAAAAAAVTVPLFASGDSTSCVLM
eukprot:11355-Heterococcus_DN1.PRE.3